MHNSRLVNANFYPRSPCGERQNLLLRERALNRISIHALLAESDRWLTIPYVKNLTFLSTLSLRRATSLSLALRLWMVNFYPRSPCGERRSGSECYCWAASISIHALLAESDPGPIWHKSQNKLFLSTLSLRRATDQGASNQRERRISIHALLAESDGRITSNGTKKLNFYPRSPCGERLLILIIGFSERVFLSTLSLRRATVLFA